MFKLLVFKTDSKDFNQGAKLNWKANLFVLTEAWLYELTKICIWFANQLWQVMQRIKSQSVAITALEQKGALSWQLHYLSRLVLRDSNS